MTDPATVARQHSARPGWELVNYQEVGLPIFRVRLSITVQKVETIAVIEEFILRLVKAGLTTTNELSEFLGLEVSMLETSLGNLVYEGDISLLESNEKIALTSRGQSKLVSLKVDRLVQSDASVYFDGITRELVALDAGQTWLGRDLERDGIPILPASPKRKPAVTEIELKKLNSHLTHVDWGTGEKFRVLRLDAMLGRAYLDYRRAVALAFKSTNGKHISIAFAIDNRLSAQHERVYKANGLGERSPIFGDLFNAKKRRANILAARSAMSAIAPVPQQKIKSNSNTSVSASGEISQLVRPVTCYEHPGLLLDALQNARHRLVIVSPWIRGKVVDEAFLSALNALCERNVNVTFVFGFGVDRGEREQDTQARKNLEKLSRDYKCFRLLKGKGVHAKVLIKDNDYVVSTSFNWLSFKGDLKLSLREEEGTLVADSRYVDQYHDSLISRLAPE